MSCPLCGGERFRLRHQLGDHAYETCRECGVTRLVPFPSAAEVVTLYQGRDYFETENPACGYDDYRAQRPGLLRTSAWRNRWLLPRLPHRARLLEVGCGLGYYAEALREQAPACEYLGLDLNPYAVEVAVAQGLQVRQGSLASLPPEEPPFDAAVLFDVLEHVVDPVDFLSALAGRLKPGARVMLATPDTGSLLSAVSGPRWVSYKVPQHVLLFERRSLTRLLAAAGFRLLVCRADLQWVTPEFLLTRVIRVWPGFRPLAPLARWLGQLWLPVPNGNLLAVAERL